MRKLIFILIALISFSQAQTIQYIGAPTTTVISRGNFRTDSIFYLPKRTKTPTDTAAFRYQISDSSLYYWTGYQWTKVQSASSFALVDTAVISTRAYRQKGIDSVQYNVGLKVNISDTSNMLSPYLRKVDTATLSNRINLKLNVSDTSTMLSPYARTSNVNASLALKLNISDTSTMLSPYFRKVDTLTLSNRINLKLNISDTSTMLSPYARTSNVNASLATKVNISDTSTMLSPYLRKSDTLTLSNRINLKVNISDTASMLTPYLRKVDTTAMLSPYYRSATATAALATKLNISDTSTMLSPYIRHAGYGLTKSSQALSVDTALMATRLRVGKVVDSLGAIIATKGSGTVTSVATGYGLSGGTITTTGTLIADTALVASRLRLGKVADSLSLVKQNVLTNPVTGTGTTNYVPKFTGTSTIGNSQIFDNGTNIGINEPSPTYKLEISLPNSAAISTPLQIKNYSFASATPGQGVQISFANERGATSSTFSQAYIRSQITNIGNGASALSFHNWNGTSINEYMRISSTGNVGIRESNPSIGLVLNGSAQILGSEAPSTGSGLELYSTGSLAGTLSYNRTSSTYIPHLSDGSELRFLISGVERSRFNTGGELLINTTTDAGNYRLQVSGNAYVTGDAILAASSGNVGIGTTSPSTLLTLSQTGAGTVGPNLRIHNTSSRQIGNTARISFAPNADYTTTVIAAYIDVIDTDGVPANFAAMAFGVGAGGTPTERMRIASIGNVGIGTTSPSASAQLDVSSTTRGFLPPRMTTTQRDAISSPVAGLVIYNTTTSKLQVYTTSWTDLH